VSVVSVELLDRSKRVPILSLLGIHTGSQVAQAHRHIHLHILVHQRKVIKLLIKEASLRVLVLRLMLVIRQHGHSTIHKVRIWRLWHTGSCRLKHVHRLVKATDPELATGQCIALLDHLLDLVFWDVVLRTEMATKITVHVEAVLACLIQTRHLSSLLVAHTSEHGKHRGLWVLLRFGGLSKLLAITETEMVCADVLIQR
jgi:hypothetical protein